MSSDKSSAAPVRSHSIHIAIRRDYERIKMVQKLDNKLKKEFLDLERRFTSHAKWNQRADTKNIRQILTNNNNTQEHSPITLEEFLQRQKIKHDNILNAKKLANQNIRRN